MAENPGWLFEWMAEIDRENAIKIVWVWLRALGGWLSQIDKLEDVGVTENPGWMAG